MNRRVFLLSATAAGARAQQAAVPSIPFVCPMDTDVRSASPSKCPRCGMNLVAGIPEAREFAVDLTLAPRRVRADGSVQMRFILRDPKTGKPAKLQLIHEKLLHLFVVRSDLAYFAHEHPELQPDGSFVFRTSLPGSGEYRLLCDFYPENATPQMIGKTVYVSGARPAAGAAALAPDLSVKRSANLEVSLRMDPPQPLAGTKTMLFFKLQPGDGLEPYLGAWGHMLLASSDLVDMIHSHPAWEDKSDTIQFNAIFARPGLHRLWVQFQRLGVLNTVAFTVPVGAI